MDSTSPRASATRRSAASDNPNAAPSATAATSRQDNGASRRIPPFTIAPLTTSISMAAALLRGAARCGTPFVETGAVALQHDTHVARAANGTRFGEHDPDPGDAELLQNQHGDMFRQRLDQVKLRRLDETEDPLRHTLVVQRVLDRIAQGGRAPVGGARDIDGLRLLALPLPIEDPDDGFGLERANENFIHRILLVN